MMIAWLAGLLRRRLGRLLAISAGVALAVALIAALGAFLTASQSTMTARALRSVTVDWQVQVQPGANWRNVLHKVTAAPNVTGAEPVQSARINGFQATIGGTTQTTGPGVVLGLPISYRSTFPGQIRTLSGATSGVLLAQQTAANLRVRPGDTVSIGRPGHRPVTVTVAGVVDLPQADTLFQKVGAPPQSQPTAPPDNVLLLPDTTFASLLGGTSALGAAVNTQIHVARRAPAQHSPAAAYQTMVAAAHNLEAQLAGSGIVGNNVAAALDGARSDAAYAEMLFLFLGLPGAVLAALLTATLVGAGAGRRRNEQALLRTRGLEPRRIAQLAIVEALLIGVGGGILGLLIALAAGRLAFGPTSLDASPTTTLIWFGVAFAAGLIITALVVLLPAVRDLRTLTVADARRSIGRPGTPLWMRAGLDVILIAGALAVFAASSRNNYTLVLAPEGVATISVSYWAFLGPALLWLGAALLLWRLTTLVLAHGRRPLRRLIAPLTGRLAQPGAAVMSRQRRPLARAIVLLALAVSFAASTAIFNATYAQQAEADAQLTNGADVAVTPPPEGRMGPEQATALAATPGVVNVEPIQHRFAYVGADLQDLYGVRPATITNATALQDAYFQGGTAPQLMATLAAHPDAVLVSAETVTDFQLNPGDLLNLRLQDTTTKRLRTVPFHYAGIVKEFPTAPRDSFFVANAAYVAKATGSDAVGAYLIDTGGKNQPAVASTLRQKLGTAAVVTDITQTRAQVGSSLTSVNLAGLTRLELTFAVLLAASAGGLVLAAGLAERRRTLAIISVLGARRRQLRGLVFSEAGLVTLGGLAGGTLISWALSEMLVKVLTGVFDPPPSSIAVPVSYLSVTVLAVLVALAAASMAGARASTRPAVEELREL
jgi:putative ABC transport system permease protein